MSVLGAGGSTTGIPPGELAALERVRALQTMIESARQVSSGGTPAAAVANSPYAQSTSPDFASALQAATSANSEAGSAEASAYEPLIGQAAARNGLDPAVLHGLIQQESGFDPSATSSAGATGLTQLMPGTAATLGVANPQNPAESIEGGARYLGQLMAEFGGNTEEALAAYNAGPGAVQQYGGVPPYAETQSYVSKVLGYAETYRLSHPDLATTNTGMPV
jgi:soluble lytic murein transglycosylase-like protein